MRRRTLSYFSVALDLHMARRKHSCLSLAAALNAVPPDNHPSHGRVCRLLDSWRSGRNYPRISSSFALLSRIAQLFDLPSDYFVRFDLKRSATEEAVKSVADNEQPVLRWHLPADFDSRSESDRNEILAWAKENVLAGSTDYGRYQRVATRMRFSVVFPTLPRDVGGRRWMRHTPNGQAHMDNNGGHTTIPAPPRLAAEMSDLIAFKTAPIAPSGYRRYRRWCPQSAAIAAHRYGHLFGAMAASPASPAAGRGLPIEQITFGLLAFPAVWDWYLQWAERRRGFFASSEQSMLYEAKSLTRNPTGWVRQHPELCGRLKPIEGLITAKDILNAKRNWAASCEDAFQHACCRIKELVPIARLHRDPYTAILPVLSSNSPLREYVKIAREIVRLMPDRSREPLDWACAVRDYLMFRLANHLGVRQRNLRELLVCLRGGKPRSTRHLEELRRGELRWNDSTRKWEVFIPALAFKNGNGVFFKGRPFQLVLPNLQDLYRWVAAYLETARPILLRGSVSDPGTFFVRHAVRRGYYNPQFEMESFYSSWKLMIQRYGIFNPYTKRGAIKGLLPHGPHCVRDILATHVLKRTGSYELASFAIQDNMEAVMRHYSRFLPHEKIARAADELDKVWR